MKNVIVPLTGVQLYMCGFCASLRRTSSILDRLNKNKHAYLSNYDTDYDGCCGECATAKYYDKFWPMQVTTRDSGDYKAFDVGGYQVRATSHNDGHLIIRPNDSLGQNYILAITSKLPDVRLVGSFNSTDAKVDRFKHADQWGFEYWRVDQNTLLDLPK